jgi:hypothetical protein
MPSGHGYKNKPGPEGVVVCKVMLANRKCNYCKELGHLKAECPKLLRKQNPGVNVAPMSAPKAPPGSWAAIAASNRDSKLVAQIEEETAQIKVQQEAKKRAISEKKHQEYLEREARRQEKKRIAEELEKAKENAHIADMIEKWGSHRWHQMVEGTEDDCRVAYDLRYKEMEEEEREYYEMQEREKEWEKEWEEERNSKEKLRTEARLTMTPKEFREFEMQEQQDEWDEEERYFASGIDEWYYIERQQRADSERLAIWEEKQKNKIF